VSWLIYRNWIIVGLNACMVSSLVFSGFTWRGKPHSFLSERLDTQCSQVRKNHVTLCCAQGGSCGRGWQGVQGPGVLRTPPHSICTYICIGLIYLSPYIYSPTTNEPKEGLIRLFYFLPYSLTSLFSSIIYRGGLGI
jgi:hypothetical protein